MSIRKLLLVLELLMALAAITSCVVAGYCLFHGSKLGAALWLFIGHLCLPIGPSADRRKRTRE